MRRNRHYHSNSFFLKKFQATKLNLHKVYIHLFTGECSHTGMDETFNNLKTYFTFEVFKKSGESKHSKRQTDGNRRHLSKFINVCVLALKINNQRFQSQINMFKN